MDELERQLNDMLRDLQQSNERELLSLIDMLNAVIEGLSMRIGKMLNEPRDSWDISGIHNQLNGAHELRHNIRMMLDGLDYGQDTDD